MHTDILLNFVKEAQILSVFKNFCNKYDDNIKKVKIRNILAHSKDQNKSVFEIIKRDQKIQLNYAETSRLLELITSFLKKSNYRKKILYDTKKRLLIDQNYKCKICEKNIELESHADHIVPFKYVGDELQENLQMLCSTCNKEKSYSIDYQIKVFLKLN